MVKEKMTGRLTKNRFLPRQEKIHLVHWFGEKHGKGVAPASSMLAAKAPLLLTSRVSRKNFCALVSPGQAPTDGSDPHVSRGGSVQNFPEPYDARYSRLIPFSPFYVDFAVTAFAYRV